MGTDICGWIEIRPVSYDPLGREADGQPWIAVADVGALVVRDYDAFGCLFGVRDALGFVPVAANRGIPPDASFIVQQDVAQCGALGHDQTWVGWNELKRLDWDEAAPRPDRRLSRFVRDETGRLRLDGKLPWQPDLAAWQLPGGPAVSLGLTPEELRVGQEWELNGAVYRVVLPRRSDALGEDWRTTFKVMEALAGRSGDDGVRLVVWFML